MRFAHPWFFALLALVPAFVWWQLRKRRASLLYSDLGFLRGATGPGSWSRVLVTAVYALALAAMVFALARPQRGRRIQDIETRGIDIMLCMDISETMLARDFLPSRLGAAKNTARDFIDRREGDRIGLVLFATNAITQCPLTLDRNVLEQLIERAQVGMLEARTAIGLGLATAVARLKDSKAKNKVVVLLTDGINNTGGVNPLDAAQVAATFGVKVYTIGVGSEQTLGSELDTKTLQQIADLTGGKFFVATDERGLAQVYDEIDRMEPTTFKARRHTVYDEQAGLPLTLSIGLLGLGMVLAGAVLRRLP